MVNFKDSVLGFILLALGIFLVYRTIKNKKKDFNDVYGNYISIYVGEVGLIITGLYLFLKELIKLF